MTEQTHELVSSTQTMTDVAARLELEVTPSDCSTRGLPVASGWLIAGR
jgi:hypothetical protein